VEMAVSDESIDFGSRQIHVGPSYTRTLTVTNKGVGRLTFPPDGIRIIGRDAEDFRLDTYFIPFTIQFGKTDTVHLQFEPQTVGEKQAILQISSTATQQATIEIPLFGLATDSYRTEKPRIRVHSQVDNAISQIQQVKGIKDNDGDNLGEVLMASTLEIGSEDSVKSGVVYLVSGDNGWLSGKFESLFPIENGRFGSALDGADFNDDGISEIIVTANGEANLSPSERRGRVYVFDGTSREVLYSLVSPLTGVDYPSFGYALAVMPDLSGDGRPDLAISALGEEKVYLFEGASGSPLMTISSPVQKGSKFGYSLSPIGDINNNSVPDLIVGAPNAGTTVLTDNSWGKPGNAFVLDGETGSLLFTLESPDPIADGWFGINVVAVGDTNGNGAEDIAVAAPFEEGAAGIARQGQIHLFDGKTGALLQTKVLPSNLIGYGFGSVMDAVPDTNGDQLPELVVGEQDHDSIDYDSGQGRVYLLDGATLEIEKIFIPPDDVFTRKFGGSVSGVPDADGDGLGDVAVWAWSESDSQGDLNRGTIYLFHSIVSSRPTTTPTPQEPLTPSPTPVLASCDSGFYLLDAFGGRHRVGNPPLIIGGLYYGADIVKDLESFPLASSEEVQTASPLQAILDGYGAVNFVGDPNHGVAQEFYFPEQSDFPHGRAVDLVLNVNAQGFWVLTDFGGIYRAGTVKEPSEPALIPGTDQLGVLGFDVPMGELRDPALRGTAGDSLRAVGLVVFDEELNGKADAYVILDSQGGRFHSDAEGRPILPGAAQAFQENHPRHLWDPSGYEWPFFEGLDIARDIELVSSQEGLIILDGWGGIHPVPVALPSNPVFFANNIVSLTDTTPLSNVGLPYILSGFDDPSTTDQDEGDRDSYGVDAASIFIDLEFTSCGQGLYTLDKFGGVFGLGTARLSQSSTMIPFSHAPYFYPYQYARDIEIYPNESF
ncbi:MAG: FG-GAP repeat protein, partial [Candidatus Omnitrophica bacterium]|nr:FG-GAP repeat protein [Candidatus Omnitrophota bacterium]